MVASNSRYGDRRFGRPSYGKPKSDLTVFGKALNKTLKKFPNVLVIDMIAEIRSKGIGRTTASQVSGLKKGKQNLRATSVQDILWGLRAISPEAFEYYMATLNSLMQAWDHEDILEVSMEDADNLADFISDWMDREGVSQEEMESLLAEEGLSAQAFREILAGRQVDPDDELACLARVIRKANGEPYSLHDWRVLCGYPPENPTLSTDTTEENGHFLNH